MKVNAMRLRVCARSRVQQAVSKGDLPKASTLICVDCGRPAQCWEHRDYTKPLDVEPVCKLCDARRGVGYPPTNATNLDIDWITRPPRVWRFRWGWIDWATRIAHQWDVTGKDGVSVCGMKRDYVAFGLKGAIRKCKRCEGLQK